MQSIEYLYYGGETFVPEALESYWEHWDKHPENITITGIETRVHKYRYRLASIWFEGRPVMVLESAGRHYEEHHRKYITDSDGYRKMVIRILSERPLCKGEIMTVDPGHEIGTLYKEWEDRQKYGY